MDKRQKLHELREWFSRIQSDPVADDYNEVRAECVQQFLELSSENPGLASEDDFLHFGIIGMSRKATSIDQQILFIKKRAELESGDAGKDLFRDVAASLVALKRIEQTEERKSDQLTRALSHDFSLSSCIRFIESEIEKNTDASRSKILKATLDNLFALSIMANRFAERLAGLPENSITEGQPNE
jgi:hypothetical protein